MFWMKTMPMIAAARNETSSRGLRMNHSSLLGGRTVRVIAPLGQFLMQFAHRLQFAFESIVRGNSNSGQPGAVSVPLKQAARAVQVLQMSWLARRASIPVR